MSKPVKPRLLDAAIWTSTALALFQFVGCESKTQSDVPRAWAMDFKGKTLGEIRSTIGNPTESSSAKQFENWIQATNEGTRMLKIICPESCADAERPTEVWILTFKSGSSTPAARERL